MAESCSIAPFIVNKDGETVPSQLFKELREVFEYEEATKMYGLATEKSFKNEYGKKKWFSRTELGEVRFGTLMHVYLNSKELKNAYPLKSEVDIEKKKGFVSYLIDKAWEGISSSNGYTIGATAIKIQKDAEYSLQDAIHLVYMFNKHHGYSDRVLATLNSTNNGKFKIDLVEANRSERKSLAKHIKNLNSLSSMQAHLEKLGVKLNITDNANIELTQANAEELAQGYTHVLEISEDENVSKEVARKMSKLLVEGLRDTNYIMRIMSVLEQKTCRKEAETGRYYAVNTNGDEILDGGRRVYVQGSRDQVYKDLGISDEEKERIENSINPAFELTKEMVATAIHNAGWNTQHSVAKNLVDRFVRFIKGVFSGVNRMNLQKSYEKDIKNIESYAEDVAGVFLGYKYDKELQRKVNEINEIDDKLFTQNMKIAKQCYRRFNAIKRAISDKTSLLYKEVSEMSELIALGAFIDANDAIINGEIQHEIIDTAIVESAIETMHSMIDSLCDKMENLYSEVTQALEEDEYGEMVYKYGDKIRETRMAINEFNRILLTLSTFENIKYNDRVKDRYAGGTDTSMNDMLGNCRDLINHISEGWRVVSDKMAIKFLETQLGYKYVKTTQHKMWKGVVESRIVSIEDIVSGKWKTDGKEVYDACKDLNWFDYQLGAMSNTHDLCMQACDVINKTTKSLIDKKTLDYQNRLRLLHTRINNTKIRIKDPITGEARLMEEKDFYERTNDTEGALTGNYLTEYNWHQYEKDKKAFMYGLHKKFNAELKSGNVKFGSPEAKAMRFKEWSKDAIKDWNIQHSYLDKESGMTYPLTLEKLNENGTNLTREEAIDKGFTLYESKRYSMLVNSEDGVQFKKLLEEVIGMKGNLDDMIEDGFIPYYRCPQFRTHLTEKMRNHRMLTGNTEIGKVAWNSFIGLWMEDSDWIDFGNNIMGVKYNHADPLSDPSENTSELVTKIPLYGINKLGNVARDLSTDTCHSLLAYANMAINYRGMKSVASGLEMVGQSMHGRLYANHSTDNNRENKLDRKFNAFMQAQVYGCGIKKVNLGNIVQNRLVQFSNYLASMLYLGGNFKGALVNSTVACENVIREALVGQEFGPKTFVKANHLYHSHMAQMALGGLAKGDYFPNDEVGMFIRYFNTMNNSREKMMDWTPSRNFINGKLLSDVIMCPYTVGDHYSSSIGYLCKALDTTIYDENGKEYNLLEAYGKNVKEDWIRFQEEGNEVLNRRLEKQKQYGLLSGEVFLKDKSDISEYKVLAEITKVLQPYIELNEEYNGKIPAGVWNSLMKGVVGENGIIEKGMYDKLMEIDKLQEVLANTKLSEVDKDYLDPSQAEGSNFKLVKDSYDKLVNYIQGRTNEITWGFTDEANFENESRQLNTRMHGVFNNLDRGKFFNTVAGRVVGCMKGYALGYVYMNLGLHNDKIIGGTLAKKMQLTDEDKKFMEEQYKEFDEAAKVLQLKDEEGMILSFLKLFSKKNDGEYHIARNFLRFLTCGFSGIMPYKQGSAHVGDWTFFNEEGGMSKSQWYNLRRFEWSILFLMLQILMKNYLLSRHNKHKEKHKEALKNGFDNEFETSIWEKIMGVVYYTTARSAYEQMCWILPSRGSNQELVSLFNLIPIAFDAIGDVAKIFIVDPLNAKTIHGLSSFSDLKEKYPDKFKEVRDSLKEELGESYSKFYYTQDGYGHKEGDLKCAIHMRDKIPFLKDARMWRSYEDEGAGGYSEWNAYLYGRNMK